MPLPNLDPARAPEELFSDIMAYIEAADASVKARDMVLLAGLDTAVEALCKRVVALAPEEGKKYAEQLTQMHERLDILQANMTGLQKETSAAIASLNSTKKANNAYKKNAPEA